VLCTVKMSKKMLPQVNLIGSEIRILHTHRFSLCALPNLLIVEKTMYEKKPSSVDDMHIHRRRKREPFKSKNNRQNLFSSTNKLSTPISFQ